MVFGYDLQHMAPVRMSTSGFCMAFQDGSLVFLTPEPAFGPQIPDLDPGGFQTGWEPFGAKNGARKNMILMKKWFTMGVVGDLCEGCGL